MTRCALPAETDLQRLNVLLCAARATGASAACTARERVVRAPAACALTGVSPRAP